MIYNDEKLDAIVRSMPFWGKLTEQEANEYRRLQVLVTRWAGWCALSKTKKQEVPKPYEPTDDEFMRCELLAMKGWNMEC